MSRCSAPVNGHKTLATTANCPAHGLGPMSPAASSAAMKRPTLEWTDHRNESDETKAFTASKADADPRVLAALAYDPSFVVRRAVAENPRTPSAVLGLTAAEAKQIDGKNMCLSLAKNPSMPADWLEKWADDEWYMMRRNVAGNPSTPPDALQRLSVGGDTGGRQRVAENPSTPAEALSALATGDDSNVRRTVAENPNLPAGVLAGMADDADPGVRVCVGIATTRRVVQVFGVDESNVEAIAALREQAWWTFTPESPEVILTRTLYPNA